MKWKRANKFNKYSAFTQYIKVVIFIIFSKAALTCSYKSSELHFLADGYVRERQGGNLVSSYGHENIWVERAMRANCYGFINFLLKRHFPSAQKELYSYMKNHETVPVSIDNIPCPFHFSTFFNSLITNLDSSKNFEYVPHKDVRPGDIIIYEPQNHTPEASATFSTTPTGMHIMIVNSLLISTKKTSVLEIIDCTKYRHDKENDSRAHLPKGSRGGIGCARLFLMKNKNGEFNRLKWSPGGKIYHKTITIGRLKAYMSMALFGRLD